MGIRRAVGIATAMVVWLALTVGLVPGAEAAVQRSVTLSATPTTVAAGDTVVLKGKVSRSPRGTKVLVDQRRGSRWVNIATVRTTTRRGAYQATVRPGSAGTATYRTRVGRKKVGSRTLAAAVSPTRRVTVTDVEQSRTLTLAAPARLVAYDTIRVTGTITNTPAGKFVPIECLFPDRDWETCGTGRTTSNGTFVEEEFQIQEVGRIQVRARVPRDGGLSAAVSAAQPMHVYGADNSGATQLVSITPEENHTADEGSSSSALSGDGRYVAFVSAAPDLIDGVDPDGSPNVFVRDTVAGTTRLVSVTPGGDPATRVEPFEQVEVDISATGRYVAFVSSAPLVAGDGNDYSDVYVRDLVAGTTTLASRTSTGAITSGGDPIYPFEEVSISDDGRTVLFTSRRALVPADVNGMVDVYTRDLDAGTTTLVTRNAAGDPLSQGGWHGALSGDGGYAVFFSISDNIGPAGGSDRHGFYRRNLTTGAINTISFTSGDPFASAPMYPDLSSDGSRVVFSTGVVELWRAGGAAPVVVSKDLEGVDQSSFSGVISGDGSTVAFSSGETGFVAGDRRNPDSVEDYPAEAYVYDVAIEAISLASVTDRGQYGGAGFFGGASAPTGLSADGSRLSFDSDSGWLIPGDDSNWVSDVFVRDLD